MMNSMKGDLLNVGQNIMEAGIDEGASSVDSIRGHVRRQLEGLAITKIEELSR